GWSRGGPFGCWWCWLVVVGLFECVERCSCFVAEGALADGAGAGEEHRAVVEGDGSVFAEPLLSGEPVEGPQDLCHVGFDAVELGFDGPGVGAFGPGVGAVG